MDEQYKKILTQDCLGNWYEVYEAKLSDGRTIYVDKFLADIQPSISAFVKRCVEEAEKTK